MKGNSFKEFWNENKDKIKIGAKYLGIGLTIGFIKGVFTMSKIYEGNISDLIDRIPPYDTDFKDYIITHFDEFEDFIKEESKCDHSYLEEP